MLHNYKVSDASSFWGRRMLMVMDKMLPFQLSVLEDKNHDPGVAPSHAIENFKMAAGLMKGEFYGMVFQDSDVAKWLEAASYSLMLRPDEALTAKCDEIIDIIGLAQQPDGYLNTYYTVAEPGNRWTNLKHCHELYCAGHMIEAAVAYYLATGKTKLLDIMKRMADHIDTVFGPEEGKKHGYPGHQEIELALMRLYDVTGEEKYAKLAVYFINERGKEPYYFEAEQKNASYKIKFSKIEGFGKEYAQWHKPVREQSDVIGHAVRELYMCSGMAAVAAYSDDEELKAACKRLWDSAYNRQRYITGAYGAQEWGESFSIDYELPNDLVYGETCASVAMCFFSQRMLKLTGESKYADAIENVLYNALLSGTQLDGSKFFYCNPLEAVPGVSGVLAAYKHNLPVRPGWFGCACCPPNLARLVTSLPSYAFTEGDDGISVNQYLSGDTEYGDIKLHLETGYPWNGDVDIKASAPEGRSYKLRVRIPGWCRKYNILVNGQEAAPAIEKGYAVVDASGDTEVLLTLDMPVERNYANSHVRADAGCVALSRGPVIYCLEGHDNTEDLHNILIPRDAEIKIGDFNNEKLEGIIELTVPALIEESADTNLYFNEPPVRKPFTATAIPYYTWSNRGLSAMRVWIREG